MVTKKKNNDNNDIGNNIEKDWQRFIIIII